MSTPTGSGYQLPKRRRLYLMRHGDVTYFDASGRTIDPERVPLNENGRAQADAAGRAFAEQNVRFDRVIASGLPRTVETAQRVLAQMSQHTGIDIEPAWEEIRSGKPGSVPAHDLEAAPGAEQSPNNERDKRTQSIHEHVRLSGKIPETLGQ